MVEDEALVKKSVWSDFWSFLGLEGGKQKVQRKEKTSELAVETKRVPNDEPNAYYSPKPKPPDDTEALAITPLIVSLHTHWGASEPKFTLHIVNTTSCFELWFEIRM